MSLIVNIWWSRVRTPAVCLVVCLCWIVLHEGGHVLAGLAAGAKVRDIVIFSLTPHVILDWNASAAAAAVACVSGSGLFLAAWFLFVISTPLNRARLAVEVSSFLAGIELLAWTLASLQYPGGTRSYDVWKFLRYSGVSSWTVAMSAVAIALAGAVILRQKYTREAIFGRTAQQGSVDISLHLAD
ncbi:MAG TPA: hypothetical protein VEQ63_03180 [Bryobacteraceae bacterium]|nr:hypothetical protein [Bryobacteraceae bacterium]